MTYIKIGETLYPATINGRNPDREWDNRHSKTITFAADYATAQATFTDEVDWSIVIQDDSYVDPDTNETIIPAPRIIDNSEFSIVGSITDNMNGTITVKVGIPTSDEIMAIIFGGN